MALWIFAFLYFTNPLDVNQFTTKEKLLFLPIYGLVGALSYLFMLPIQKWLYKRANEKWYLRTELIFLLGYILLGLIITRSIYLYIIVAQQPNPYTLDYFIKAIYFPAILTILPIVIAGRWAFGKYKNKQLENQKIDIEGEGTYEGIRLHFNAIICIKADDNYIEISYLENQQLKKQLIRNKLSVIADTFPDFLRTHRSYLVNPYHFQQWKNENGKSFIVLPYEILAPVSKTYTPNVKQVINFTTN